MISFEQYKAFDFDRINFKKQNKNYLWDVNKGFCPKDKFFILKAISFQQYDQNIKEYKKSIEYIDAAPSDVYMILNFYAQQLNKNNDILYILSHTEIEKFNEMLNQKDFTHLSQKSIIPFMTKKDFIVVLNKETRKKTHYIISYNSPEDYLDFEFLLSEKGDDIIVRESVKKMKQHYMNYIAYINDKMSDSEKESITHMLQSIKSFPDIENLSLIDMIRTSVIDENNLDEKKEVETLKKIDETLIYYKQFFNHYENQKEINENILSDSIIADEMLDLITLYRHDKEYFKDFIQMSEKALREDVDMVKKEHIRVKDTLEKIKENL